MYTKDPRPVGNIALQEPAFLGPLQKGDAFNSLEQPCYDDYLWIESRVWKHHCLIDCSRYALLLRLIHFRRLFKILT